MISPLNLVASRTASAVFPTAVGPTPATRRATLLDPRLYLGRLPGNGDELIGLEARSADERAVDVRLLHQSFNSGRGHAAAVEDAHRVGDLFTVAVLDELPDEGN